MQSRLKKYALSCLVCRRRKVKCDGGRPNCANCVRLSERCNYNVQDPTITRLQNALVRSEQRFSTLERNLQALLVLEPKQCQEGLREILAESDGAECHTPQASSSIDDPPNTVSTCHERPSERTDETREEEYEVTSRFHDVEERPANASEQDDREQIEYHKRWLKSNARFCKSHEQLAFSALQNNDDIDAQSAVVLLNIYWTWQAPLHNCVYRRNFFRDMVMRGPYFSEFLLNVIYAHASRHILPSDPRYLILQGGEPFLERAKQLLLGELKRDRPAIPTIQGLLILGGRQCAIGRNSEGWLYTGMAIRMIKDIGLHLPHRFQLDTIEPDDLECHKRLYLSAYAWDKSISLCLGRPPSLTSMPYPDDCLFDTSDDTELWTPFYLGELEAMYSTTCSCNSKTFSSFVKLSTIINTAYKHVFGPKSRHVSFSQLKIIEDELYAFYRHLPADLQMTEDTAAMNCPPPHICCLNILYHTVLILLYRPFFLKGSDDEELCAHAATICARESAAVNVFFQAYGRCFANRNQTYLLSYCVYTAATIEVERSRDRNSATAQVAIKRLATTLTMLEDEARQTPGVRRSVDIIKARLDRVSPQMRRSLVTPARPRVEPSNNLVPHSDELQYQTMDSPRSLLHTTAYEQAPDQFSAYPLPWLETDLSFQNENIFTPDVGGGFVPDILSWYTSFD